MHTVLNKVSFLVLTVLLAGCTTANIQTHPMETQCRVEGSNIEKQLVATADAAILIFLAVEADLAPWADRENYPDVDGKDEGEWWSVWRHKAPRKTPEGKLLTTRGGNQLSMKIAKCDGQISGVHYIR